MPRTHDEVLEDIKKNPQNHIHDWNALYACCMIDGAIDLSLLDAHKEFVNPRGNRGCDVISGPCGCGGWH